MKILKTIAIRLTACLIAFSLMLVPAPATASNKDVDPKLLAKTKKARAIRQRAQLLARRGLFDTALATYQRALRIYPKYPAIYNEIGVIFVKQKAYDRAVLAFEEALRMNPEMSAAWGNLAEAQRRLKRHADAIKSYKEFLKRSPEDSAAHYGLAACYGALKNDEAALWALERYMALDPTGQHSKEVTKQAASFIKRGTTSKAPTMLAGGGAAADPKDPKKPKDPTDPKVVAPGPDIDPDTTPKGEPGRLKAHAGDVLFSQKRYVAAIKSYLAQIEQQRAKGAVAPVSKAPTAKVATAKVATAKVATKAGAKKAAKKGPVKAVAAKPAIAKRRAGPVDVELLYKVGATYAVMGDYRLALRWWRRALVTAPDRELLVRHIGLASRRMAAKGQLALALPASKSGAVAAARAAMVKGEYGAAMSMLKGLTDREAYYLRGEAALRLGKLKTARDNFRIIVKEDPKNQAALGGLAEALVRLNDTSGAQKALNSWLGDRMVLPEEFLVLRRGESASRIQFGPSADKPGYGEEDDDF